MSRVQQWKRERFDAILSNPSRLLFSRLLLVALLGGAVCEAWFARTTLVDRMDRSGTLMRRLVALEDSVDHLRTTASDIRLDSARTQAYRGAFEDWDSLAAWLEGQRVSALREGWALDWRLTESGKSQPFPYLHRQEVELHLTMATSRFQRAQDFLRKSTESDNRRMSLARLQGSGDHQGITDLTWTLFVWVRTTK